MNLLSLIFPSLSLARKLRANLTTRALIIKPMMPVEPYTCVVSPRSCDDPRLLPTIRVFGTIDTDESFTQRVQTQLRSVCSFSVTEARMPIAALDGCTASKSSPRERTLLAWGNTMDPGGLLLPFLGSTDDHLARCLHHTFPRRHQERYRVDHLTWTEHGHYLHNSDGSHHLAYAIALMERLGVRNDHHIEVTRSAYTLSLTNVQRLEDDFGAYVMQSNDWYHVMAPLMELRVPYARATLCHNQPIHDPAGVYFLDARHPLTPVLKDVLDGLVERKGACRLHQWLHQFNQ